MTTNGNGHYSAAARRMVEFMDAEGRGRDCFYFRADGRPLIQGGRRFGTLNRSSRAGTMDLDRSMRAAFAVEYPYRPSLASCEDMVREHARTGQRVVYGTERWENDKRVDEQIAAIAPADVVTDWKLEQLMDELERREEIAA